MDVTPLIKDSAKVIQGYGPEHFKISGELYQNPIFLYDDTVTNWSGTDQNILNDTAVQLIEDEGIECDVLLIGMGASMTFPPSELRKRLKDCPFAVEYMDTGAACRTYNVLMAEGRHVALALLLYR